MADDLKQNGKANDARIDVDQDDQVKYWADKFGVTQEEIREAVRAAGPMVKDVQRRLGAHRSY